MSKLKKQGSGLKRRDFLVLSAGTLGALGTTGVSPAAPSSDASVDSTARPVLTGGSHDYNGSYSGDRLDRVAFPMGGMGAGMICLEGRGALSHFSLRNRPEVFNEPVTFAALCIKGSPNIARVLEGPVPIWKKFGAPGTGTGASGTAFGLPRFHGATFTPRFPFATVALQDPAVPMSVEILGWSPFEPGDPDNACLPAVALEYRFANPTSGALDAVFSWSARNFMIVGQNTGAVKPAPGGFILWGGAPADKPWDEGAFSATVDDPAVRVDHSWFRGGWWDPLTMAWNDVAMGNATPRPPETGGFASPGGTLYVPFTLAPGQSKTIVLRFAWHVPQTNLRIGHDPQPTPEQPAVPGFYQPWYTGRFAGIDEITSYWRDNYAELRRNTSRFSDCFHDSTLPPEVMEAVCANLSILKSPTVLRQADGRLWGWEGCDDSAGCCHGSCTHVWNYAQAIPHLFPTLERTLRETEFNVSQDERGHQQFRTSLPIRPVVHDFHAASDGQLGGIMKVCRDWRISGDTAWLRGLWPRVCASLDYCIRTWDPGHTGCLVEPHHNTYDIEFWGPDPMCTSFYLGALQAATLMGKALGYDVSGYAALHEKGSARMSNELFDGNYFVQHVEWKDLHAKLSTGGSSSPEAAALVNKEGPNYQYGTGSLADGVLGAWMAEVCGVGQVAEPKQVASHLRAVHTHNLKTDLTAHANPQRPAYACGDEGGLLLCTWPNGGKPSLPFVYSDEVWTGIEYQAASHLMMMGMVNEGLEVVRTARDRYDGRTRNPFNEYECGHWYARAMSSYALLQGLGGARYDAIDQILYLQPSIQGDFRSFLATATGYGTVGVKGGKPFLDVKSGAIVVKEIKFKAA
jgi:uncharacterized protein (DUF608 family)